MFEKGEKIIYGKTGVCVVEDIAERAVPGGKRPTIPCARCISRAM